LIQEVGVVAAVPKNKRSKSKRDMKRNSFKLTVLSIVECPRCRAKKVAHRVCKACGYYDNKEIIKLEKKSKEKQKEKNTEKKQKASKSSSVKSAVKSSEKVTDNIKEPVESLG
jgi:large subunit ribosomal protein L32